MSHDTLETSHEHDVSPAIAAGQNELNLILEEYRRRQMLDHLAGPLISLVVHVVVMGVILVCVGAPPDQTDKSGTDIVITTSEPIVRHLPSQPKVPNITENDEPKPIEAPIPSNTGEPNNPDGNDNPVVGTNKSIIDDPVSGTEGEPKDSFFSLENVKTNVGVLKLPGAYTDRVKNTGPGKGNGPGGNGPSVATTNSVNKALKWLKEHQNDDGSWSKTQPVAMTGLALLTYLAHNETHESPLYGMTVQKAMQYLANAMTPTSGGGNTGRGGSAYAHAIGTYALAEAYGMTRVPTMKIAMEAGLTTIVQGQQPKGGWDYQYFSGNSSDKPMRWDLSVSGWQMQALKAGYIAGADVPGLHEAIEKAITFTKNETFDKGQFGYSSAGKGSTAVQGVGVLCLQLLGEGKSPESMAGVNFISQHCKVDWAKQGDLGNGIYGWYYQTQAMYQAGGKSWDQWNRMFVPELTKNQKSDGHWEHPNGKGAGEYDPYYQTTLCALMLQVYYRLTRATEAPKATAAATNALDLGPK